MNIRQGLFRVWIIATVLFVIGIGVRSYSDLRSEFHEAYTDYDALARQFGGDTMYPMDCAEARGNLGTDYYKSEDLCWYTRRAVRLLFPEYQNLNEHDLDIKLYADAGRPVKEARPWLTLAKDVGIAFGLPSAVLLLGWSLLWAFAGFRRSDAP